MLELFGLISILDGLIVGKFLFFLCRELLGDNPSARLIRILLSVGGGIGYSLIYMASPIFHYSQITPGMTFLVLVPFALQVIVWIINYMYKK